MARLSGVPVRKVLVTAFAQSGLFVGLAGLLLSGPRLGPAASSGDPQWIALSGLRSAGVNTDAVQHVGTTTGVAIVEVDVLAQLTGASACSNHADLSVPLRPGWLLALPWPMPSETPFALALSRFDRKART